MPSQAASQGVYRPAVDLVAAGTPMGPALPGSKLARRAEGQQLVKKLIADGWKPGYLAEELEVSYYVLATWRDGQRAPTPDQLEHLRELARPGGLGARGRRAAAP